MDCGNSDSFRGTQNFTDYGYQEVYMDGSGSIIDWGDRETNDSDEGEIDNYECSECDSDDIQWFEDEEFETNKRRILEENGENYEPPTPVVKTTDNWKEIIEE